MDGLNRKVAHGVFWNLANMVVSRGASVVFTLFLAKFLAPEAFGLMAMIAICYALADALMTSGFGQAIIRQKELDAVDLSTAFFTNLALSLATYLLLYAAAPWIARFYAHPELEVLIRVTGLILFVNALKVVQLAQLNRDMDFKALMRINSTATLVSGVVAVGLAYAGLGVWSLVAQFMTTAAVSTGLLWVASPWRPIARFSMASFRGMFGFGSRLTLESVLNVLYENSYVLVIGKFFSAEGTGLYYFAKRIRDLVVDQVNSAVQQATYPAMAQMQDEPAGLKRMYRAVLQLLFFAITPGLALIALLAAPLFQVAFHERWLPAAPYLQLMCVAGILFPVHTVNFNMLKVKGRTDLVLYVGLVKKGLHLLLLAVAIPYGIQGILVGQIAATVLSCLPYMHYSAALLGYGWREQFKDMLEPIAAAGLAVLASGLLLRALALPDAWSALAGAASFTFIYVAASHAAGVGGYRFLRGRLAAWRAGGAQASGHRA